MLTEGRLESNRDKIKDKLALWPRLFGCINIKFDFDKLRVSLFQRWSRGHKAQGQGQGHKKNPRPRPRTAFPRTNTLEAKDRNARGQGHKRKCSPKKKKKKVFTKIFQAIFKKKKKKKGLHKNFSGDLQKKKKKKVFTKIFQAISTEKRCLKNFSSAPQNFNNSKNSAVLEPRTGQFSRTWGLEAKDLTFEAKAKDFKICPRGRPRGQGRPRGLHLWFVCYHPLI